VKDTKRVEFLASLPPIKSAILLDGQGDGGQVKLEVPRSYAPALLRLQEMAGHVLRVTVEIEE
jgi:hypothetical protein